MDPAQRQTVAAVDLGSNSFHMLVARLVDGEVHVVDKLKEKVALASGLDDENRLTDEAQERALACLEKFGQRLRHMHPDDVRAVGTNALRRARNTRGFLERAEPLLGHPIEVVSGREEARLIYVGVAHWVQPREERRLVVDIGGGSTECVVGRGLEPLEAHSLYMGHIEWTERFFKGGKISQKRMKKAETAASIELQSIEKRFAEAGWRVALGASGTIETIQAILRANGWSDADITADGLASLREALLSAGHVDDVKLDGLDDRPTLVGGFAILNAVFGRLGIEGMRVSDGALREGVLHDLLGRFQKEDIREVTVDALAKRHHVDADQAQRVERTASLLLEQAADYWELGEERDEQMLRWASRLHEAGLALSHSGYHKHGEYILANADMPGFSKDDQQELATLVLCHRRKLRASRFDELPRRRGEHALRLSLLLRLAVRLNRARNAQAAPPVRLNVDDDTLVLTFPKGWLEANPLTRADLEQEDERVQKATPFRIEVAEAD